MTAPRVAVFGATSAIATAVARQLAERGAAFVLIGRDGPALDELDADLNVRGASSIATLAGDLSDPDDIDRLVAQTWERFDGLDIALLAHGSLPEQLVAQDNSHVLVQAIHLNLISPAAICEALAQRFEAARAGTIAVITSVAGDRGRGSNYIYGAAKGGLQRYLEGLRHRLHPACVQVLDVRPGFVTTRMTAHLATGGPLWAEPKRVAADIVQAIDRRRRVVYTPWFWRWIMLSVRALPTPVFHRLRL